MHDTRHSLAAESHTHAAYEHWVADYQQKRGEEEAAQEFARRAFEHSQEAARQDHRRSDQRKEHRQNQYGFHAPSMDLVHAAINPLFG